MNPLTLVKRTQKINSTEAALGISEEASWHAKYKDSAYVFVGGVPYDLTEGDLLAVFAQYGEVVDVNLVRDKATGKSKGFAFLAYEDQRSTILAVDNLNGAKILGRIVRVDHVSNYKKKEEEDEEKEQQKREERGVCRAFQRGECNRGASCKFSHNEQRAANSGWGSKDDNPRWGHDRYDGPARSSRKLSESKDPIVHRKTDGETRYESSSDRHSLKFDRGIDCGHSKREKHSEKRKLGSDKEGDDLDMEEGRRSRRHEREFSSHYHKGEDRERHRR